MTGNVIFKNKNKKQCTSVTLGSGFKKNKKHALVVKHRIVCYEQQTITVRNHMYQISNVSIYVPYGTYRNTISVLLYLFAKDITTVCTVAYSRESRFILP